MTTEKLLTCMITGFAAGAVVGILFAPDKGTETRRKISEKNY
jgi:gas vesicle protein